MSEEQLPSQFSIKLHNSVGSYFISSQEAPVVVNHSIQSQQQNMVKQKQQIQDSYSFKQDLQSDEKTNNSFTHSFLHSGLEHSSLASFELPTQPQFSESFLGSHSQYLPFSFLFSTAHVQEDDQIIKEQSQKYSSSVDSLLHIQLEDDQLSSKEAQNPNLMAFEINNSKNLSNSEIIKSCSNSQNQQQQLSSVDKELSHLHLSSYEKDSVEVLQSILFKSNNTKISFNDENQYDSTIFPNPSPSISGSLKDSPKNEGDQENYSDNFNEKIEEEVMQESARQQNKMRDLKEEDSSSKEEDGVWPKEDDHPKKLELLQSIEDVNSSIWEEKYQENDRYLGYLYSKMGKNNMVKNILQMFITFILERGDDVVVESLGYKEKDLPKIRKELKNFLRKKNLNNNTLISFLKSQRYSKQFIYYLRFYAVEYFLESKVIDKQNHLICIAFFYRCKFNESLLSQIIIYNKSKYFKSFNKHRLRNEKILEENLEEEEACLKNQKVQSP